VLLVSQRVLAVVSLMTAAVIGGGANAVLGVCGPFTDVSDAAFCPFVLEIFTLGITTGTSPTTYDPTSSVSRLQMAAFLSRTVDGVLKRGSRRTALDQFWTPQGPTVLGVTTLGNGLHLVKSDGVDLWVARLGNGGTVSRVRGSDGKLLETWTGATGATGVLVAMGRIFVTGNTSPGNLYQIDPSQAAGAVTTVASNLGDAPQGITFDGSRIWIANFVGSSISIVTPGGTIPWTATTVTTGFSGPTGALYDGANVWVTDNQAGKLLKLDESGAILQTVTVGAGPDIPTFDGTNIWVPNVDSNSVSVVRASNGAVLATLTGNGLSSPFAAAFDGQRVLVTLFSGDSVALWKAADLTSLGVFGAGSGPFGVCSDGVNFWITLTGSAKLARF
jgi:YVTN family beta-propeller protein